MYGQCDAGLTVRENEIERMKKELEFRTEFNEHKQDSFWFDLCVCVKFGQNENGLRFSFELFGTIRSLDISCSQFRLAQID